MNSLRLILIFAVFFYFGFAIAFRRAPRKFIKISSKKNDNWKQMAEPALCSARDSDNVMEALTSFDKMSHWFVLVSPTDRAGRRRQGRSEARGLGWSADHKLGELHHAERCGATMLVWRAEIGLDRSKTRGCHTSRVKTIMDKHGNLESYQDPDIDQVRKEISLVAGHNHHFFIMWNLPGNSKQWKWSSFGMGLKESECLVHNSNSFFFMEPEGVKNTGGSHVQIPPSPPENVPANIVDLRSALI